MFVSLIIILSLSLVGCSRIPSCKDLPTVEQVENILTEHQDVKEEIETYGQIFVSGRTGCPGKAYIDIDYSSIDQKEKIESLIGETFFGVPYVMSNV